MGLLCQIQIGFLGVKTRIQNSYAGTMTDRQMSEPLVLMPWWHFSMLPQAGNNLIGKSRQGTYLNDVRVQRGLGAKFQIQSTLNIDLILWHTQLIMCAENVKSWFKSRVFPFTFQAHTLPHTFICVSLLKFHICIFVQFWCCSKRPALPRHIKV